MRINSRGVSDPSIAVDDQGIAYVAGTMESPDLPTTLGSFQLIGGSEANPDGFVAKLDPARPGDGAGVPSPLNPALVYSTYLGGTPGGRTDAGASGYDPAYDVALGPGKFGGAAGNTELRDTWTFNGATGTWKRRAPSVSPSARQGAAFSDHPPTGHAVLFGGQDSGSTTLDQTWLWDGTAWTREG